MSEHADTGTILSHHFDDLEQQHESSSLGMWAFLATEVMFFGGLFAAYAVYRSIEPRAFIAASRHLDVALGGINTVVLLASSLCMALAVRASQLQRRVPLVGFLVATMVLGAAFLGIKAVEYSQDYRSHLIPGYNFDWAKAQAERGAEASPITPEGGGSQQADDNPRPYQPGLGIETTAAPPRNRAEMFFVLYFFMTGLHAVHIIIGITLLGVIATLSWRGWLSGGGATQVEMTGLYWHFVDIVWVFLYPLLYLIDVHK